MGTCGTSDFTRFPLIGCLWSGNQTTPPNPMAPWGQEWKPNLSLSHSESTVILLIFGISWGEQVDTKVVDDGDGGATGSTGSDQYQVDDVTDERESGMDKFTY